VLTIILSFGRRIGKAARAARVQEYLDGGVAQHYSYEDIYGATSERAVRACNRAGRSLRELLPPVCAIGMPFAANFIQPEGRNLFEPWA
jgi:hypothetical protein